MTSEPRPSDVFISHSKKDLGVAAAIKQTLQARRIRCWKAPDDIRPGERWAAAIIRGLSGSRTMVLVWSGNSMGSPEVAKELNLAMRRGLTVVPFRIEDVAPIEEWDYHLANTHWMDAFEGEAETHYAALADHLLRLLPDRAGETVDQGSAVEMGRLQAELEEARKKLAAAASIVSIT